MEKIRNFARVQNYNPFQPTPAAGTGTSVQTDQFQEAIILDVIVNNDHPKFAIDGYNVGMVRFRNLTSNVYRSEDQLEWAYPLNANFTQYPLIGELIYVFRGLNRWYYIAKFNVSNRVTAQDLPEVIAETGPPVATTNKIKSYNSSTAAPTKISSNAASLGKYFIDKQLVYRLKQFEGDITIEGRSGSSIRFGAAWKQGSVDASVSSTKIPYQSIDEDQAPNLLMRVGPDPLAQTTADGIFGQVIEDINKDASSIWMVSDQIVPIKLSTESSRIHKFSINNFPTRFGGSQIFLNSNRVVINAKRDKILLHSSKGTHLTSLDDITIDSDRNFITWINKSQNLRTVEDVIETIGRDKNLSAQRDIVHISGRNQTFGARGNVSLVGSKIYIGTASSEQEPLVLGETLKSALQQLIKILTLEPIVLTTGAPGSPSPQNPARVAQLTQWSQKFLNGSTPQILSADNFTTRSNSTPASPRKISSYKEG